MRRIVVRAAALALALLAAACGPGDEQAKDLFLKTHPGSEIVEMHPGKGDGPHVSYEFRYRPPGDTTVHRACLLLQNAGDGKWTVAGKKPVRESAGKSSC